MNADEGKQTLELAHEIYNLKNCKNILYIGVHPKTFNEWNGDYFLNTIKQYQPNLQCTIVEINQNNINISKNTTVSKTYNINYIHSDIIDYVKNTTSKYDTIIWWYGPDHMQKYKSLQLIKDLENICTGIIILGCPLGTDHYEENNDKHHWDVFPLDFVNLDYETILFDRSYKNQTPSISAIKKLN